MGGKPQALTDEQIHEALVNLPGWERDGDILTKTFKLDQYLAGIAFASAVGVVADGLDHHPDMHIGYKKVTVRFNTHSADGKITAKDVDAATAIENLPFKPEF
ncbi:MAG: 4a-hydroxytetrahydrobiopterin dehydratase [Anaerolineae bacterium]|nr:4a-hydroxytetrahydrobiopterin dehydratase [Anaerolineae bacterium]